MPITIYPPITERTDAEEIDLVEKGVFVSKTILSDILTEMKINNSYMEQVIGEKLTMLDIEE